ncbi:gas vesicle protein [Hyalangium versicolor]|uniref:gas vesicle protein n=1 Tax=Hyalangium versicolor TaxID=2861190 RepID=UPI001CCF6202|nr:gas vesicle protein [Hyalangium versicolor]
MPLSPRSRARPTRPANARRCPASHHQRVSLCETLDRVLNKGVVIVGDAFMSMEDVDLSDLGLNVVATSVETMHKGEGEAPTPQLPAPQLEGE